MACLVAGAGACDTGDRAVPGGPVAIVTAQGATPPDEAVDESVDVLVERIAAALPGAETDATDRRIEVRLPTDPDGVEVVEVLEALLAPGDASINPVVAERPRDGGRCASGQVPSSDLVTTARSCFDLGPAVLGRDAIAGAESTEDPTGGWQVGLRLTVSGTYDFNVAAAQHFGERLAIVVDGAVISAPTVREVRYEGTIVISGGFSRGQALALATILDTEPLAAAFALSQVRAPAGGGTG